MSTWAGDPTAQALAAILDREGHKPDLTYRCPEGCTLMACWWSPEFGAVLVRVSGGRHHHPRPLDSPPEIIAAKTPWARSTDEVRRTGVMAYWLTPDPHGRRVPQTCQHFTYGVLTATPDEIITATREAHESGKRAKRYALADDRVTPLLERRKPDA